MKIKNMMGNNGREVANQFVIENDNEVLFQSYQSPIIEINYNEQKIKVYEDYDYSRTTGKYRNKFLDDMGFYELSSLKDLNKALKNNQVINGFSVVAMF